MPTYKAMPKIDFVSVDDWTALYFDGKMVTQDHSLDPEHVLELLGIKFESHWLDDVWDYYEDEMPDNLEDLRDKIDRHNKS